MITRTTHGTVRFTAAFWLPGLDVPLPAGEYRVDKDEEPIRTEAHLGWVRIGTFIHLPSISTRGATQQTEPVDPAVLEATIEKDRTQQ